ncbi:MAG: anti-sigma factor family protein [Streptosporangiales bacterium]
MSEDRFATFDAAYVLGALSPEDRRAYEQHLSECADCARAVRELAGVPGLLGKVPEELATAEHAETAPPATLLPTLLWRTRRTRRRRRALTGSIASMAAAACLALLFILAVRPVISGPGVAEPTTSMTPVVPVPVHATIGLEATSTGTRVAMHCVYEQGTGGQPRTYALVLVGSDGDVEHVASWAIAPGDEANFDGSTPVRLHDIKAVEIRTSTGQPLLRVRP